MTSADVMGAREDRDAVAAFLTVNRSGGGSRAPCRRAGTGACAGDALVALDLLQEDEVGGAQRRSAEARAIFWPGSMWS
jgi:hypothetical protein